MADTFYVDPQGKLVRVASTGIRSAAKADVKSLDSLTGEEISLCWSGTFGADVQKAVREACFSRSGFGSVLDNSVAFAWIGQSLEGGATTALNSQGVARRAFIHAPAQGYFEPDPLAKGYSGSYLTPVLQKLAVNDGIRVMGYNCAIGGTSLVRDWVGILNVGTGSGGWRASTAYRGARTSLGNGDPGTKGDLIYEGGRIWECTTGNIHLAFLDSVTPVTVGGIAWRSQLTYIAKDTSRTSAASKPTFDSNAIVGATTTDSGAGGGLVWTCRVIIGTAADVAGIRVLRSADYGFDPYYALERAANALMSSPLSNRFLGVSNATGDVQLRGWDTNVMVGADIKVAWARAHQFICNYMIDPSRGIRTIHWLSLFNPANNQTQFDFLEQALYGNGLSGAMNVQGGQLYAYLTTGSSYPYGVPGSTTGNYYIIPSLYRTLGLDVSKYLASFNLPHPSIHGNLPLADAVYPHLRRIFLDVLE